MKLRHKPNYRFVGNHEHVIEMLYEKCQTDSDKAADYRYQIIMLQLLRLVCFQQRRLFLLLELIAMLLIGLFLEGAILLG